MHILGDPKTFWGINKKFECKDKVIRGVEFDFEVTFAERLQEKALTGKQIDIANWGFIWKWSSKLRKWMRLLDDLIKSRRLNWIMIISKFKEFE